MAAFTFAAVSGATIAAATGDPYLTLAAAILGFFVGGITAMTGEQR